MVELWTQWDSRNSVEIEKVRSCGQNCSEGKSWRKGTKPKEGAQESQGPRIQGPWLLGILPITIIVFPLIFSYTWELFHSDLTRLVISRGGAPALFHVLLAWFSLDFRAWVEDWLAGYRQTSEMLEVPFQTSAKKVNFTIRRFTWMFWLPSVYKSFAYTIL